LNNFKVNILDVLRGKKNVRIWAKILVLILSPLGFIYSILMSIRRTLFEKNIFKSKSLLVPVISIGNISLGGTGKTPVIVWLIKKIIDQGLNPAVISRGYRSVDSSLTIVSDGKGNVLTSPPASDEAVMLSRLFPNVPIVTGTDRIISGDKVISELNADVVLVDDGFQYLKLRRNFDLLLFHGKNPFGNGRVFPSGFLREPVESSKNADAFLVTGEDKEGGIQKVESLNLPVPIFTGELVVDRIFCPEKKSNIPLEKIKESKILAFSGIGNPDSFDHILNKSGFSIVDHLKFSDHTVYNKKYFLRISRKIESLNPEYIITTEKDEVKLGDLQLGIPMLVLKVEMKFDDPDSLFQIILEKIL